MRLYTIHIVRAYFCFVSLFLFCGITIIEAKNFTVVIDAGHGGHDPGALGRFSKEKDINLNVALKFGKQIEKNCPDVNVIYTRKKDTFIPLDRRAEIANNAKADLFISIHTNSIGGGRDVSGTSTWTLGLAKSDANLAVAKRENSVILYESDYRSRYAGFNPNSSESYIIFEFMQDKYMSQSVHLASLVQKEFYHTCKRADRGVHQAGFLVLKASAMPSILVELGFISNQAEERYLNSESGSTSLANGLFRAFLAYKQEHEMRLTGKSNVAIPPGDSMRQEKEEDKQETHHPAVPDSGKQENIHESVSNTARENRKTDTNTSIRFAVQILTSSHPLSAGDKRFKGLRPIEHYRENGLYKYIYGSSEDYNRVLRSKREIALKFKDAFIVAFKNGEKVNVNEAIREFNNKNK